MDDTITNEIFNKHLLTFNHNVAVDNNNTAMIRNTTNYIIDYTENFSHYVLFMFFMIGIIVCIMNCELKKINDRIDELEERLPEKQPLLATF